jgi:DNA-binding HxlR family transcriptional regulator
MESGSHFDSSRAELFEALGHPTRVKILRALETKPMGFAELKREVGIESSGHLQFHLGKLAGLVTTNAEGSYTLTDEGKEAIRVLKSARFHNEDMPPRGEVVSLRQMNWAKPLLAGLLIAVIALGAVAVYQQQQIATMNGNLSADTVMIGGARYYYESITPNVPNGTGIIFHGVTFTFLQLPLNNIYYTIGMPVTPFMIPYTFHGSLWLSNGTLLDLSNKTVVLLPYFGSVSIPLNRSGTISNLDMISTIGLYLTFPDGAHEEYNAPTVTAEHFSAYGQAVVLNYTYPIHLANPWFGQHTSPSAGVYLTYMDTGTGIAQSLTLYVSAS